MHEERGGEIGPDDVGAQVEYEYAGFWVRVSATVIDMLLLVLLMAAIFLVSKPLLRAQMEVLWSINTPIERMKEIAYLQGYWLGRVLPPVLTILFWFYRQATPGKMAMRLKIVDADSGGKLSFKQCIGRYCAYFLSFLFFFLGVLWVVFDERKQGWHDKLAGTLVVRMPRRTVRFSVPSSVGLHGGNK